MGVSTAENFDFDETGAEEEVSTAIIGDLTSRGWYVAATTAGQSRYENPEYTDVDGTKVKTLRFWWDWYAWGGKWWSPIGVPIPGNDKPFYVSFRAKLSEAITVTNQDPAPCLYVQTIESAAFNVLFRLMVNTAGSITAQVGTDATTERLIPIDSWVTVEIFYDPATKNVNVWLDDIYMSSATLTVNPSTTGLIYMGNYRDWGRLNFRGGFEISDVVVVDPSTPGLQYRPGKTCRVRTLEYAEDVVTDWNAPENNTEPHNVLMSQVRNKPLDSQVLSSVESGAREQYKLAALPDPNAKYIPAIVYTGQMMNGGAALHSYAMEMDIGSGIEELAEVPVTAGAGYIVSQKVIDGKIDGTPWSPEEIADAKVGFSVKS